MAWVFCSATVLLLSTCLPNSHLCVSFPAVQLSMHIPTFVSQCPCCPPVSPNPHLCVTVPLLSTCLPNSHLCVSFPAVHLSVQPPPLCHSAPAVHLSVLSVTVSLVSTCQTKLPPLCHSVPAVHLSDQTLTFVSQCPCCPPVSANPYFVA